MITRLFTRQLASQRTVAHVCQVACSITGRWYLAAGLWYYQSLDTIRAFPDKADGIQRKGIQFTTIRTVEIEEVLFGDFCDHEMVVF
jgi:hypothetical protein